MDKSTEKSKQTCKERRQRLTAKGLCVNCGKEKSNKPFQYCLGCGGRRALQAKMRTVALRRQILKVYGTVCACCGESNEVFLTIDHINNDGCKERHKEGKHVYGTDTFYRDLLKNKRDDIQILCFNCNCAKERVGICPHQNKDITLENCHNIRASIPTFAAHPEGMRQVRLCGWKGCGSEFNIRSGIDKFCDVHKLLNQKETMRAWRERKKQERGPGFSSAKISKLNINKVIDIVSKLKNGQSVQSLSIEYGVTYNAIKYIKQGKNWKSVTGGIPIINGTLQ